VQDESLWQATGAHNLYRRYEAMLCIGDGYIFVFEAPLTATYFAAYLAHLIELSVARKRLPVNFHFRIGIHVGEVYTFWDPGRDNWNYIGAGINGGNRVLSAIEKHYDDILYVSGEVREAIMADRNVPWMAPEVLKCLHNRGRQLDKHGNPWRVYELNHTDLCGQMIPNPLQWDHPER
jgi:class 3 adenylate cyclase